LTGVGGGIATGGTGGSGTGASDGTGAAPDRRQAAAEGCGCRIGARLVRGTSREGRFAALLVGFALAAWRRNRRTMHGTKRARTPR
jgi:hypothetical protein